MAKVHPIPPGRHTLTPNLTLSDCAKAIDFYKQALGAEVIMNMPAPDGRSVWHAELRVGDSVFFCNDEMPGMGARAPSHEKPAPVGMWLAVGDCDAAFQRAVDAGARASMPPADMFWGDRTATVLDPFGYAWTFATHVRDMSMDEMEKAGREFARKMGMKG
jgi:uncharacterized glyoxalase superfamily protein PhnB